MQNLTLLALDTSTEACSVALLYCGEKTHINELAQRTHTKRILPMIDEILANSGLHLNQVDALAFGRGPGSFTGVRVGAGMAFELHQAENVVAAIDARMNEVYFSQLVREKVRSDFGEFFQWQEIITEQVCSPEQAINQLRDDNAFRVGTGWAAYSQFTEKNLTSSDIMLPNALYMLELARVEYLQKRTISALEIEPIYLRNEVTWKKLPGRE